MSDQARREEGATAVIVAICLLLLFGAGAIAIDLGSAWETKRDLVVDTDAAALAGTQVLAAPGGDCDAAELEAASFLSANLGETVTVAQLQSMDGATLDCDETDERVTVSWTRGAQQTLSGAVGAEDLDVFSSSTAQLVDGPGGGGLRPFSVCMQDTEIQAWLGGDGNVDGQGGADSGGTPDDPNSHRVLHERSWKASNASGCGGAAGNWGLVCYDKDAGGCNASGLADMVLNGYEGVVDLESNSPDDGDCIPDSGGPDDCDGQTGAIASLGNELQTIECPAATTAEDCDYQFPILGINSYTGGAGTNATLHPTHFVGVVVRDSKFNGPPSGRHITFELVNLFEDGTSATLDEGTPVQPVAVLCGGDGGDFCG